MPGDLTHPVTMPGDLTHLVTLNRMLIGISIVIERSKVNDKVKIYTRLFSYHSYAFILDILSMLLYYLSSYLWISIIIFTI